MVVGIDVVLKTQLSVEADVEITVVRNHSFLENLDYDSSGHIGFASENYVNESLALKVDKVDGKGLSTNDYTFTAKQIVDNLLDDKGRINESLIPHQPSSVIEFDIQVNGADFLSRILESEIGTMIFIAANKTYTGDFYYRKFAVNTNGTEQGIILIEPVIGVIYVSTSNANIYRWTGFNLVEISKSISLGESSTTAYAGNKGKENTTAIAEIKAKMPDAPLTPGSYKLQVVVDEGGNATYNWVID